MQSSFLATLEISQFQRDFKSAFGNKTVCTRELIAWAARHEGFRALTSASATQISEQIKELDKQAEVFSLGATRFIFVIAGDEPLCEEVVETAMELVYKLLTPTNQSQAHCNVEVTG